jgi:hypothetical protein
MEQVTGDDFSVHSILMLMQGSHIPDNFLGMVLANYNLAAKCTLSFFNPKGQIARTRL